MHNGDILEPANPLDGTFLGELRVSNCYVVRVLHTGLRLVTAINVSVAHHAHNLCT